MSRLFEWQNLIFVLSLLLGSVMVLASALGLVSADGDLEPSHELAESDHDHSGATGALLATLGAGRAPLSVFVIVFLLAFGASGLGANLLFERWLSSATLRGALAIAGSALLGFAVASFGSRLVARFVPSLESYATERDDVVGTTGVAEMRIASDFGVARVSDRTGTPIKIKCRAHGDPIAKGSEILVVDWDEERAIYTVDTCSTDNEPGER